MNRTVTLFWETLYLQYLGGNDSESSLLSIGEDFPGLPPLVVGGVGHVEDVAVAEGEAARGEAVVQLGLVVEQCAHVQGPLRRRPNQSPRHCLLNLV